jgi:hypothetical protein
MDETLVEEIVLRYRAIVPMTTLGDHLLFMKVLHAHMTHPLQLDALLIATDEDLVHDVEGIAHHFDTNAGVYRELFWPRYAAQCGGQCNHAGH